MASSATNASPKRDRHPPPPEPADDGGDPARRQPVQHPGEQQRDRDRGGEREVEVGQPGSASRARCRSARRPRRRRPHPSARNATTKPTSSTNCASSIISATRTTSADDRPPGRPPADEPLDQVVVRRAPSAGCRPARRASERSRPSSSSDSNSGGDTLRPVTAIRTGPKATRGLSSELLDQRLAQGRLDVGGRPATPAPRARRAPRVRRRGRRRRARRPARTTPRRRTGSRASATASVSLFIRSATSGIASSSSWASASSTGSVTHARPPARNGTTRWVSSSIESIRMWSALIASAFLRSKRAGLGFTSLMSNASTISSSVKTSRSGRDRPAEQGQVVEQPLGQEAVVAVHEQVRLAGRAWRASCCPRP